MSNHQADVPDWITHDYVEKLLQKCLQDSSASLESFKVSPGSSVGDNYMCQMYRIQVQYQGKSLSLIGKVLPQTELAEKFINTFDLFGVEASMLTETLPALYDRFPHTERFTPKVHLLDQDHKVMVMEDLCEQGYRIVDRSNRMLDLEHAQLVVKSLATLHAHFYTLVKENPSIVEQYNRSFWSSKNDMVKTIVDNSYKSVAKVMDKWPISEEQKVRLRAAGEGMYESCLAVFQYQENSFNSLLHGDCWVNNIMFRHNSNGELLDLRLLDFQCSNYNSIGLDLNNFFFTSCSIELLTDKIDHLLEYYYTNFTAVAGDVQGFSLATVRKEFFEHLSLGLFYFLLFRVGVLATKAFDLDAVTNNQASDCNLDLYENENFVSQIVQLLPFFEQHGVV